MNQKSYFGVNSTEHLSQILLDQKVKNIFLVTSKNSFETSGARKIIMSLVAPYKVEVFNDFSINPSEDDLLKGVMKYREHTSSVIIAVGGGSVIDVAKLISLFADKPEQISEVSYGASIEKTSAVPVIAVPTTAGSGSESTHFAVLYIKGKKYSCADKKMLPEYAIVDPQFLFSSPWEVTAASGVDAFCQSIESWWSVNSSKESLLLSENAFKLLYKNLYLACGGDKDALVNIAQGSHSAGKAINITKTTLAHALSYPLTSRYKIPHGKAVALFLPEVFMFNLGVTLNSCSDPRGYLYVRNLVEQMGSFITGSKNALYADSLKSFFESIQVSTRLRDYGISIADAKNAILDEYSAERAMNNPRLATVEDIVEIIHKIA
ncbi:MAG: phosphonoacetaldehyde reductase [Candidatus Paceibacterota bacterium]